MSRFTKIVNNREYVWGFDVVLQEYFFQCFDQSIKNKNDDVVFSISSYFSEKPHHLTPNKEAYTRGQILTIIVYEENEQGVMIVPIEHKDAIAMDSLF